MSSLEKIYEIAVELGKFIAQTDEFKSMKQGEQAILHDEEAAKAVELLNNAKMELERKRALGKLTEEDNKQMAEVEKEVLSNTVVKESFEANAMFNTLMQKISVKIRDGIREYSE